MRGAIWIGSVALAAVAGCTAANEPGTAAAGAPPPRPAEAKAATGELPYVVRTEGGQTLVSALHAPRGQVIARTRLAGRYELPVVVPGGPAEGLSTDRRTLVLQGDPAGSRSRFAVLDAKLAGPPKVLDLPGHFGYDAMSPDGSILYLIEYLSTGDATDYAVRALDVPTGRLRPDKIVDKREPDEVMAGRPLARAANPDGTVVATLYLRNSGEPFVHLLYTRDAVAFCADLPPGATRGWALSYPAGRFLVTDPAGTDRYAVDPQSAEVTALA